MIAYYGHEISPNQTETQEGFLICRNVPIARTGAQDYLARELQLGGDPERIIKVMRLPEDVFSPATLASFEGKPVTDGHPPENVMPENFNSYARGHIQNVRREGDFIVADLYINDAGLASDIKNGVKREVSCGYLCNYVLDGTDYKQEKIRGNHVAVVQKGRAGHEVAIKDTAEEAEKGRKRMKKETKEALCRWFGLAARDAEAEELEQLAKDMSKVLGEKTDLKEPENEQKEKENKDEMVERAPKGDDLGSKLDKVIEMLASLTEKEEKLSDEDDIDNLIGELTSKKPEEKSEGESITIPVENNEDAELTPAAKDAAVELLKRVRPAVAAIQNKQERARVTQALVGAIKGPDVMGDIINAARDSAQQAADASKKTKYEAACAESQANYDARNPHKNKKED